MADYLDFFCENQLVTDVWPLGGCGLKTGVGFTQFNKCCLLVYQRRPRIKLRALGEHHGQEVNGEKIPG